MDQGEPVQVPLHIKGGAKRQARSQISALCYRIVDGKVKFLLITSRRTRRWIIPKGWPESGKSPAETAAQEAFEEAGVTGEVDALPIGVYSYIRQYKGSKKIPFIVMIYPLHVSDVLEEYPEMQQRKRKWVGRKAAAKMVREPELQHVLKNFKAAELRR